MRRVWHRDIRGLLWWSDPYRPDGEGKVFVHLGEKGYKLNTQFGRWAHKFIDKNIRSERRRKEVKMSLSRCWCSMRETRRRARVLEYKPDLEAQSRKGRCLFLVLADRAASLELIKETLPKWVSCNTQGVRVTMSFKMFNCRITSSR